MKTFKEHKTYETRAEAFAALYHLIFGEIWHMDESKRIPLWANTVNG